MGVAPDYSKLSPELQEKIKGWEANNPANKQLVKLNDIASILQDVSNVIDYRGKKSDETLKQLGAVLSDAREQLVAINAKEAPEAPDTSKPVIEAISKLEKALTSAVKAVDVKPVVNVPKIDAPVVNVSPTDVTVDTKEIAKILKTDIPQAFDKAIKSIVIPKNDTTEANQLLEQIAEQLSSIDTAVRMQPQAPTTISVTNPDGSSIGSLSGSTAYESRNDTTTDTNLVYLGKALPGSATSDAAWQIKRYNKSAGHMSFADDVTTFTKTWDARTSYTY